MQGVSRLSLYGAFAIFLFLGCGEHALSGNGTQRSILLSEAIQIGKQELRKVGYAYWNEELAVEADDENTVWNKHVFSSPSVSDSQIVKKMRLYERDYWAIYYFPKKFVDTNVKGGDAFVFIDRLSGETIGTILGE